MWCFSEMEKFLDLDALKKKKRKERNNAKISGHFSGSYKQCCLQVTGIGTVLVEPIYKSSEEYMVKSQICETC